MLKINFVTDEPELPVDKIENSEEKNLSPPPSPENSDDDYSPSRTGYSTNYSSQTLNNKINNIMSDKNDKSNKNLTSILSTPFIQTNEFNSMNSQKNNNGGNGGGGGGVGTFTGLLYKTHQTTTAIATRGQISPVNGLTQRFNTVEGNQRKRCHTAPREKHRVCILNPIKKNFFFAITMYFYYNVIFRYHPRLFRGTLLQAWDKLINVKKQN